MSMSTRGGGGGRRKRQPAKASKKATTEAVAIDIDNGVDDNVDDQVDDKVDDNVDDNVEIEILDSCCSSSSSVVDVDVIDNVGDCKEKGGGSSSTCTNGTNKRNMGKVDSARGSNHGSCRDVASENEMDNEKENENEKTNEYHNYSNNGKLPSYLANAFQDLYEEDGLLVCGRGMGLLHLLASFCRFYASDDSGDGNNEGHIALLREELELEKEKCLAILNGCGTQSGHNGRTNKKNGPPRGNYMTANININHARQQLLQINAIEQKLHFTNSNNDNTNTTQKRSPLIFVIGLRDYERSCLISILQQWGTPANLLPMEITNENGQSNDRHHSYYQRGGIYLITSRILIVDLLTGVASPKDIDGIFVAHAEHVTETSTEAFIVRIYRTQRRFLLSSSSPLSSSSSSSSPSNTSTSSTFFQSDNPIIQSYTNGFIKAFSDAPHILTAGFAKVDKVMKSLFVRRLYIYPRFHELVVEDLERPIQVQQVLVGGGGHDGANGVNSVKSYDPTPIVEELHQVLSPRMKDIQGSIVAAVKACIREIKKSITTIDWTEADLTLENCVTTNFDLKITHQLESEWHKLKPKTKQLINDLRQLRTLFHYLLQYDCIAFWRLINNVQKLGVSSRNPSMWLTTPAADRLFKVAKERIYKIVDGHKPRQYQQRPSRGNGGVKNPVKKLMPILEENPKWRLLHQVLSEIENRQVSDLTNKCSNSDSSNNNCKNNSRRSKRRKRNSNENELNDNDVEGNTNKSPTNGSSQRVLVMVKDERTLDSVRSYLVDGREVAMKKRWLRYLTRLNDQTRALAKSAGGVSHVSEESRLLLEEEGKIRNFLFGSSRPEGNDDDNSHTAHHNTNDSLQNQSKRKSSMINTAPSWRKKRRKIQEERSRGNIMMESAQDREQMNILDEAVEETEQYDIEILSSKTASQQYGDPDVTDEKTSKHYNSNSSNDDHQDLDHTEKLFHSEEINGLRVVIQTYSSCEGEQAYLLLNDIKPSYVVLYDTEPSFIRSIEVYSAGMAVAAAENHQRISSVQDRLRVYFMLFEASSEEKNYLRALEREQNAFERLIQHKKTMALPMNMLGPCTTQEMQLAGGNGAAGSYCSGTLPLSVDTRTGRGKRLHSEKRDIAVDVREFRSALPSILHQGGMRLAPVTLTVGDFVLSNIHCVERKSISDLFGSFASGRLFTQAETMSKHYKVPCLLIEFDPSKTFCLQNVNEIGPDLRSDSVCTKMALLVMHFPKLRLLWSRSPHETLKIFKELKVNHEEVDVEKAVSVGSNESIDALLLGNGDNNVNGGDGIGNSKAVDINEAGKDMLLRLPGITVHNARKVMQSCDSIAELASLTREEMKTLLGPLAGQKLFTFFHKRMDYKIK